MIVEGHIGQARYMDDQTGKLRLGSQGELITSDMNGLFGEQTIRGNGFVYSTTTAASITALGNNIPSLWNPKGSNKILVLTKLTLQVGAVGTPVATGIQYGFIADAGSQIGTASPVLTGTFVNGISLAIGGPTPVSAMKWAPAAITFTTAPALLAAAGLDMGSTATETPYSFVDDINGRIVLYPGGLIQVAASTATSKTFNVSIWGLELPLPGIG